MPGGFHPLWCFYLTFHEEQIPAALKGHFDFPTKNVPRPDGRARYWYDYPPDIGGCHLHGGITYYTKHGGIDNRPITYEFGCDFNHLNDQPRLLDYDLDYVLSEVVRSIDEIRAAFPELKHLCLWDAKYYNEDEGEYNKAGSFMSYVGRGAEMKKRKELNND